MNAINVNAALAAEGITLKQIKSAIIADSDSQRTGGISYPNESVNAQDLATRIVRLPGYRGGYLYGGAIITLDGCDMGDYHPTHWVKNHDHRDYAPEPCQKALDEASVGALLVIEWDFNGQSYIEHYRKTEAGWLNVYYWSEADQSWEDRQIEQFGCLLTHGVRDRVAHAVGMQPRSVFHAAFDAVLDSLERVQK